MERPDEFAAKIFSGASDSKLPSNVADRPLSVRRQWVGAWNGRFRDCQKDGGSAESCESSAFAVANAAIKDITDEEAEKAKFIDAWEVFEVQLTQQAANYGSIGGSDERACGNCQWFISPNGCSVVKSYPDPINPNGVSDLWRERVTEDEFVMPVRIVEDTGNAGVGDPPATDPGDILRVPKELAGKVKDFIAKLIGNTPDPQPTKPFTIFKDIDGATRWLAYASNRWRDRDNPPEIIEDKAHQDFVDYLVGGGIMPEAWLWHVPGSRWGKADWVDYDSGFLMVSGTVDPGMEHVADALAKEANLGVSHGFRYRHSDPEAGIIGWYRSFEISPLPLDKAANVWTSFEVISKEIGEMNQAQRDWLVTKLGEEATADIYGQPAKMQAALDAAGIDTKDMPPDDPKEPVPALSEEATKALMLEAGKAAAEAIVETEAFKGILASQEKVSADIKGILGRLDELEQSDDQKLTALVTGKREQKGFVASKDGDSVITEEGDPVLAGVQGPTVMDWAMDGLETEKPVS